MFVFKTLSREVAKRRKFLVIAFTVFVSFQADDLPDDSVGVMFVVANEGKEAKDRGQDICEEEENEEEEIGGAMKRRRFEHCIPVLV